MKIIGILTKEKEQIFIHASKFEKLTILTNETATLRIGSKIFEVEFFSINIGSFRDFVLQNDHAIFDFVEIIPHEE